MHYRELGRTGWKVSALSFGAWAMGGTWGLVHEAVTCAIPGAKRPAQAEENFSACDLPPIPSELMKAARAIYEQNIQGLVHHYW